MSDTKERGKTYTESNRKASLRYQKENMVQFNLRFGKVIDADILEKLNSVPNKRQYIIGLIREDIAREQQK